MNIEQRIIQAVDDNDYVDFYCNVKDLHSSFNFHVEETYKYLIEALNLDNDIASINTIGLLFKISKKYTLDFYDRHMYSTTKQEIMVDLVSNHLFLMQRIVKIFTVMLFILLGIMAFNVVLGGALATGSIFLGIGVIGFFNLRFNHKMTAFLRSPFPSVAKRIKEINNKDDEGKKSHMCYIRKGK